MNDSRSIEEKHTGLFLRTCKNGRDIQQEMTFSQAHLLHMVVGVCGEAGELLDTIKKYAIYQKDLDYQNLIEELGDIEFYLRGIYHSLDITREEVLERNIEKLEKRYPKGYTNEAAQTRADKA